jgi:HAD superfamily hydrolase (TIGR01509 family)
MNVQKKIQAVIFDLDGVLAETRQLHYQALSMALNDLGLYLCHEEHEKIYNGLPTFKKIEILSIKYNFTPDQVELLNRRKQEYTVELIKDEIKPNSQHSLIFEYLRARNIKIAVCSNTKRNTLDFVLKNLQIDNLLEFSLSNEDVTEPKPSPEIYLNAMKLLKTTPEETIIIEDSPHGLLSALTSRAHVQKVEDSSEVTLDLFKKLVS